MSSPQPVINEQPELIPMVAGRPVTLGFGADNPHHHKATLKTAEWHTGLLCCCSGGAGTCLYGFCCPPCATASARSRFDNSDWWMNLFFLNSYTAYKMISEGYSIETDPCCDCYTCRCDICRGFWCMPCTVVQMLNEVKFRNPLGPNPDNAIYFGPQEANENWQYGLCSCTAKMETCPFITVAGLIPVLDLFCLSAFNAQALTIQENHIHNGHGLSTMEHGYDFSDGCCTCGYDGWWFNWCCVNAVITRNYIREDNQIGGCCKSLRFVNIFMEDILPTWCCYACTTCQNLNEVLYRSENEGTSERAMTGMNRLDDSFEDTNPFSLFGLC